MRTVLVTLLAMSAGCSTPPLCQRHYEPTPEGKQGTLPPTKFIMQSGTIVELAERLQEYLAQGYVSIGGLNFVTKHATYPKIAKHAKKVGAEIVLCADISDPKRIWTITGPVHAYRHIAVYLALPVDYLVEMAEKRIMN